MNKPDLARKVAENTDIGIGVCEQIISSAFNVIAETLIDGEKVGISGFGSFNHVQTKERNGRDPKRNVDIVIPAKTKVKFTPSSTLKESVNK